jgi:hypothetical protein
MMMVCHNGPAEWQWEAASLPARNGEPELRQTVAPADCSTVTTSAWPRCWATPKGVRCSTCNMSDPALVSHT